MVRMEGRVLVREGEIQPALWRRNWKASAEANRRLADASIIPTIPRLPTNLTWIMIGERLADLLGP